MSPRYCVLAIISVLVGLINVKCV